MDPVGPLFSALTECQTQTQQGMQAERKPLVKSTTPSKLQTSATKSRKRTFNDELCMGNWTHLLNNLSKTN